MRKTKSRLLIEKLTAKPVHEEAFSKQKWEKFAEATIQYDAKDDGKEAPALNYSEFGDLMAKVFKASGEVESNLWVGANPSGSEDRTWCRVWAFLCGASDLYKGIMSGLDGQHANRIAGQFKAVGFRPKKVTEAKGDTKIVSVFVSTKVSDGAVYDFLNKAENVVGTFQGYVPQFFPDEHYNDYLYLNIDIKTGKILNWPKGLTQEDMLLALKKAKNVEVMDGLFTKGKAEKSPSVSKVLQLMDNDVEYQDAVKQVSKEDGIDLKQLEKDLEPYV